MPYHLCSFRLIYRGCFNIFNILAVLGYMSMSMSAE